MGPGELLSQLILLVEGVWTEFALVSGTGWFGWFKAIPRLWNLLVETKEFLVEAKHTIDTWKKDPEIRAAIDKAKNQKDPRDLEKLFGGSGDDL